MARTNSTMLPLGTSAPDFALQDVVSGRTVALADFKAAIDAPYGDAKALLLQTLAEQTRCRTVFHAALAMSSVIGYPTDLKAVELLFTSLLVQAQRALAEASVSARPARAPDRRRSAPPSCEASPRESVSVSKRRTGWRMRTPVRRHSCRCCAPRVH